MVAPKVTNQQILEAWPKNPSITVLSEKLGISHRQLAERVRRLRKAGHPLTSPDSRSPYHVYRAKEEYSPRLAVEVPHGVVPVGSDPHYAPGVRSTAHRAFVWFCEVYKPRVIVMNGDVFDGGGVGRWPRIGWEHRPTVKQEVEACQERLGEIEKACPGAEKVWCLGNHDSRYELKLAERVPEYEGMPGFSLKDAFPLWKPCWSLWVTDNTVIKHRFKGGLHATHNNTVNAGKSIVNGHLHSLKVTPYSDYNGTRYGVDTGTMAAPYGGAFEGYMEDNPRNWRSGFAVLTYRDGILLWPEIVHVLEEGKVEFRGKVYSV